MYENPYEPPPELEEPFAPVPQHQTNVWYETAVGITIIGVSIMVALSVVCVSLSCFMHWLFTGNILGPE
jgi:hypothetical protein